MRRSSRRGRAGVGKGKPFAAGYSSPKETWNASRSQGSSRTGSRNWLSASFREGACARGYQPRLGAGSLPVAANGHSHRARGRIPEYLLTEPDSQYRENGSTFGQQSPEPRPGMKPTPTPLYDMVPIRHAPRQCEIPATPAFYPPLARGKPEHWTRSAEMAMNSWKQAARTGKSPRILNGARQ